MSNKYEKERRNVELILSGSKTPEGRMKIKEIQSFKNMSYDYNTKAIINSIFSGVFATLAILTQNGIIKLNNEVIKLLSMSLETFVAIILGANTANNISKKNIVDDKIYSLEDEIIKQK